MENENVQFKIPSDIVNWKWFRNAKVFSVFIWLLASANLEDKTQFGELIERGSILTSNIQIAFDCGMTEANVRAALACLEKTGDIKREKRNHYQIITVTNFEYYYNV